MVSTNVNPSYPRNQLHRLLFDEYASKIPPILLKSHIAEPVAIPISPLDGMMRFLERTLTDAVGLGLTKLKHALNSESECFVCLKMNLKGCKLRAVLGFQRRGVTKRR